MTCKNNLGLDDKDVKMHEDGDTREYIVEAKHIEIFTNLMETKFRQIVKDEMLLKEDERKMLADLDEQSIPIRIGKFRFYLIGATNFRCKYKQN